MTPEELVAAACPPIGSVGAAFYFVPETLARGKELGLDGFRFYFLGRGGVLGDVEPDVVYSAFGYFHRDLVAKMWNTAKAVLPPRDAARAYLECCRDLGRRAFADLDLDAFCAAAEAVKDAADPAGLALYAGIGAEPLPDDAPGRAMQLVAVLREFRGSAHLVAVLASGLTAREAHYLRRPDDFASFGWAEDAKPEVSDELRSRLAAADALTDRLVLPAYSAVDAAGAQALVDGLAAMQKALAG